MASFAAEITVALSDRANCRAQWRATFSAETLTRRSFGAALGTPVFEWCATVLAEFLTRWVLAPAIRTAHRLTWVNQRFNRPGLTTSVEMLAAVLKSDGLRKPVLLRVIFHQQALVAPVRAPIYVGCFQLCNLLNLAPACLLDSSREIVAGWTPNKRAASAAVFLPLEIIRTISLCC
jgi:hypothetical protein